MNAPVGPVRITLQYASASGSDGVPAQEAFAAWVHAALAEEAHVEGAITIRIVDPVESAALNERFRGKAYPTNVLGFPAAHNFLPDDAEPYAELGDVVICADVALQEAAEQGKSAEAHFAHLAVHGTLHLLGHDHQQDAEAQQMETLERSIMAGLGFADPYANGS